MLFIIAGWIKQRTFPKTKSNLLAKNKISVVVAFRNEAKNLRPLLDSLAQQQFDKNDFEVILVNDHSEDESCKIIKEFQSQHCISIALVSLDDSFGKKAAITEGIKTAIHDIIAVTDADCVLPPQWLGNISETFQNSSMNMLVGPVVLQPNGASYFTEVLQQLDFIAMQGVTFGSLGMNTPTLNNGANLAYRKSAFFEMEGMDKYNTPSGDDVFLLHKFIAKNKKVSGFLDVSHAVVSSSASSFKSFVNQRIRWASKAKNYKNLFLIYLSSIIYLINLIQLLIYFQMWLVDGFWVVGIILLLSKWLIDFILLYLAANFFSREKYLLLYGLVALIYPLYIVFTGFLALTSSFNWKGRTYNG